MLFDYCYTLLIARLNFACQLTMPTDSMACTALYQHINQGMLTIKLTIGIWLIRVVHQNQLKYECYRSIQISNSLVSDIPLGTKGCIARYSPPIETA